MCIHKTFIRTYGRIRKKNIENMAYKQTLLVLFFCTSVHGASVLFQEDIDDFTDEERISLVFYEDSNNDFLERKVFVQCDEGSLVLAIQNGIFFSISNYLDVKMRFDKKTPFEDSFIHNDNFIGTIDKNIISYFLNNAKTSTNLVIKIEENDHIMRFTKFGKDQNKIIKFIDRIQPIPGCSLG